MSDELKLFLKDVAEHNLGRLSVRAKTLLESSRPVADESAKPVVPWRCFHCDETFSNVDAAREHFGPNEMHEPACQIDIAKYREMEEIVRRHVSEDTDLHREIYSMQAKHFTDLRNEEEKGYARGLEDGRKYPLESIAEDTPSAKPAPFLWFVSDDPDADGWCVHKESEAKDCEQDGWDVIALYTHPATVASKEAVTLSAEKIASSDDIASDERCKYCGWRGGDVCDTPPADICGVGAAS